MKKIFLGVALLSAFTSIKAQTVEEIANKHVEAIGGKANIEKLQNIVMEGSISAQGAVVNLTFTKVKDKLYRQDISVMGMKGYDLTTEKDGWTFMPFAGQTTPIEKTGDALKESQKQLSILSDDVLYNYQDKGHKFELQGKADVGGTDCFKLKLTDKTGDTSTVFVDPTTYYITKISTTKNFNGQPIQATVDLLDYKEVEGVKFPFSMGTPQGNVAFTSIRVNQTIDEKLYKHE